MGALPGLVVVGARGHGREVAQLVADINAHAPRFRLRGFVDDDPTLHGCEIGGLPVLGSVAELAAGAWPEAGIDAYALGVGGPAVKARLTDALAARSFDAPSLVHPSASLGRAVHLGRGTMVAAGTVCTCDIDVGPWVTVNIGCSISHDVVIEAFATLAPGVRLAGNVRVGAGADLGIGMVAIQGLVIGSGAVVGAGAAVVRDVPPAVTAAGVPARILKSHPPGGRFPAHPSPS